MSITSPRRGLIAVALLLSVAACSPAEPAPVAGPVAPAPTSEPVAPAPTRLFGYLGEVVRGDGGTTISFDQAEWLTGQAAVAYAREQGYIGPDETSVPNDSLVRNVEEAWASLPLAADAEVVVLSNPGDPATELRTDGAGLAEWRAGLAGLDLGFWATLVDGEVVTLSFQYQP